METEEAVVLGSRGACEIAAFVVKGSVWYAQTSRPWEIGSRAREKRCHGRLKRPSVLVA